MGLYDLRIDNFVHVLTNIRRQGNEKEFFWGTYFNRTVRTELYYFLLAILPKGKRQSAVQYFRVLGGAQKRWYQSCADFGYQLSLPGLIHIQYTLVR